MLGVQLFIDICYIWHVAGTSTSVIQEEVLGRVLSYDYILLNSIFAVILLDFATSSWLLPAGILPTDESLGDHLLLGRKGSLTLIARGASRIGLSTIATVLPIHHHITRIISHVVSLAVLRSGQKHGELIDDDPYLTCCCC